MSAYERTITLVCAGQREVMQEETGESWRKKISLGDSIVESERFRSVTFVDDSGMSASYEVGQPYFYHFHGGCSQVGLSFVRGYCMSGTASNALLMSVATICTGGGMWLVKAILNVLCEVCMYSITVVE